MKYSNYICNIEPDRKYYYIIHLWYNSFAIPFFCQKYISANRKLKRIKLQSFIHAVNTINQMSCRLFFLGEKPSDTQDYQAVHPHVQLQSVYKPYFSLFSFNAFSASFIFPSSICFSDISIFLYTESCRIVDS